MYAFYFPDTKLVFSFTPKEDIDDGNSLNGNRWWLPDSIFDQLGARRLGKYCGWNYDHICLVLPRQAGLSIKRALHHHDTYSGYLNSVYRLSVVSVSQYAPLSDELVWLPVISFEGDNIEWLEAHVEDADVYKYDKRTVDTIFHQLRAFLNLRRLVSLAPKVFHVTSKESSFTGPERKAFQAWAKTVNSYLTAPPKNATSKVLPKINALIAAFKKGHTVTL